VYRRYFRWRLDATLAAEKTWFSSHFEKWRPTGNGVPSGTVAVAQMCATNVLKHLIPRAFVKKVAAASADRSSGPVTPLLTDPQDALLHPDWSYAQNVPERSRPLFILQHRQQSL